MYSFAFYIPVSLFSFSLSQRRRVYLLNNRPAQQCQVHQGVEVKGLKTISVNKERALIWGHPQNVRFQNVRFQNVRFQNV
jgi:hypothetical protein